MAPEATEEEEVEIAKLGEEIMGLRTQFIGIAQDTALYEREVTKLYHVMGQMGKGIEDQWGPAYDKHIKQVRELIKEYGSAGAVFAMAREVKGAAEGPKGEILELQRRLEMLSAVGLISAADAATYFSDAVNKMAGDPLGRLQDLRDEIRKVRDGLADWQMELDRMKKNPLIKPAQLKEFQDLNKELEGMRRMAGMREEGKRMFESLRTPAEMLRKEFTDIQELFKVGTISGVTAFRGVQKLVKGEPILGAGRFGPREFGKQIQDAMLRREDPQKKQVVEMIKHSGFLERIAKAVEEKQEPAAVLD